MTRYLLIGASDDGDPFVEEYSTMEAAANRGVTIIRDYESDYRETEIVAALRAGRTISYHDYSSIRIEACE